MGFSSGKSDMGREKGILMISEGCWLGLGCTIAGFWFTSRCGRLNINI